MNETAHRTKRGGSMQKITNSGLNSKGAAFQLPDSRPELTSATHAVKSTVSGRPNVGKSVCNAALCQKFRHLCGVLWANRPAARRHSRAHIPTQRAAASTRRLRHGHHEQSQQPDCEIAYKR